MRRPKIILIFGSGPIGIEPEFRNSSYRNVFLNWTNESNSPLVKHFQLPEYFPEWNRFEGYQNLVDFERDVGALSGAILLFSEGSGSLAELGAFCMDDVLSERLIVVIQRSHFSADSFVKHGPLLKLTGQHSSESVCVIESETPAAFYEEAAIVAEALQAKIDDHPKKEAFDSTNTRDRLLLIADLIELFGAVSEFAPIIFSISHQFSMLIRTSCTSRCADFPLHKKCLYTFTYCVDADLETGISATKRSLTLEFS